MDEFERLTSMRRVGHEGVEELLWVTSDSGAFGNERDGPLFDWLSEHEAFMEKVRNFDTVVQAGGNCGMYPRFYRNYFRNVYTFEPEDLNFYCLDRNCVGSGYHKYHAGLGEVEASLSLKKGGATNVGTHKIIETPGEVKIMTIDSLNLKSCDLIHLDIEGYEPKAIAGARETIARFKPVVITERSAGEKELLEMGYQKHRKLRMDTVYTPIL